MLNRISYHVKSYIILNPIAVLQGLIFVLQSLLTWRSHRMRLTCLGLFVFVLVIYNKRWLQWLIFSQRTHWPMLVQEPCPQPDHHQSILPEVDLDLWRGPESLPQASNELQPLSGQRGQVPGQLRARDQPLASPPQPCDGRGQGCGV